MSKVPVAHKTGDLLGQNMQLGNGCFLTNLQPDLLLRQTKLNIMR